MLFVLLKYLYMLLFLVVAILIKECYALIFKRAFLAGIIVSISAYNYLLNYDILSKIVFSFALLVILNMKLNLYTSKATAIFFSDSDSKTKNILTIYLGNALACMLFGFLFSFLSETHANEIWATKLDTNLFIVFYKAIIVGVLMQIAATCKQDLITIGAVLLFIGTSAEHSIANIVYMSVARAFSLYSFFYIILVSIGNFLGSVMVYLLHLDKNSENIKRIRKLIR